MIYVFNSAYRPLFKKNLLNTLFLPNGWIDEYRYRLGQNIDTATQTRLRKGEDVVVTFVDRYAQGGYEYHPVRLGQLKLSYQEADQVFLRVLLKHFIYPRDITGFQEEFLTTLGDLNLPKLTADNPENEKDGNYVVIGPSLFDKKDIYYHQNEAWVSCITSLSGIEAFKSTTKEQFVFVKASLHKHESLQKELPPHKKGDNAYYRLKRNRIYDLRFTYKYPIQENYRDQTTVFNISLDETVRPLSTCRISIDSLSNSTTFAFTVKKIPEETKGGMSLSFQDDKDESGQNPRQVIGPEKFLVFEVIHGKRFWLFLLILVTVYVICGVVIGTDLPEAAPRSLYSYISYNPIKFIAALIQAVILFTGFMIIGKKIV